MPLLQLLILLPEPLQPLIPFVLLLLAFLLLEDPLSQLLLPLLPHPLLQLQPLSLTLRRLRVEFDKWRGFCKLLHSVNKSFCLGVRRRTVGRGKAVLHCQFLLNGGWLGLELYGGHRDTLYLEGFAS